MGKRELLLIAAFILVGAVVYHATAPAPAPGEQGLSFSRMLDGLRRHVRGNRGFAEATKSTTETVPADVDEVRLIDCPEVTVIGESVADLAVAFRVESNGYDDAEAKRFVDESKIIPDRAGPSLTRKCDFPRGGRQRGFVTVKLPSRLRLRIENSSKIDVDNVAAIEMLGSRGEATIKRVAGRAVITHRGGPLVLEKIGTLKLTARSADVKVAGVEGDASIVAEQGGDFEASQLGGAIDLESRNADVKLADLSMARGPIRVSVNGGSAQLGGVKSETRVDGRRSRVEVAMIAAAPLVIYNEGDEIALTPPPSGGYKLDIVANGGKIEPAAMLEKLGLEHQTVERDNDAHASGTINGGGPTITIRATRGDVTIRERASPPR